jgi:hypothetical protein
MHLKPSRIYDVKNVGDLSNGELHKIGDGKFSVTIPPIGWSIFVLN